MDPSVHGLDASGKLQGVVEDGGVDGAEGVDNLSHLKFLVDRRQCGPLIGKGGANIKQLQAATGTVVRISNNSDCYPGTTSRVVLIRGEAPLIPNALVTVLQNLDADEEGAEAVASHENPALSSTIEIVIPLPAAGIIIGKGGETIKQMQEDFSCSMRISPLDELTRQFHERLLTITNKIDSKPPIDACRHVVALLLDSPDVFIYKNNSTAYPRLQTPFRGNGYGRPSRYGQGGQYGGMQQRGYRGGAGHDQYGSPSYQSQYQGASSMGYGSSSQRQQGYGMGQGMNPYYQSQAQQGFGPFFVQGQQSSAGKYGYGYAQGSYGQQNGSMFPTSPSPQQQQQQGAAMRPSSADALSYQMFVADANVGAIVGRGGETIKAININSGARVQVSQKGEYQPGTQQRIVTITGNQQTIQAAVEMINQKLSAVGSPQ